jgi:hypothetical protein
MCDNPIDPVFLAGLAFGTSPVVAIGAVVWPLSRLVVANVDRRGIGLSSRSCLGGSSIAAVFLQVMEVD